MSKTFSTEGFVLKRFNYGDADRLVTLYTQKMGKLVAIAKGARKTVSTKKAGLEPGTKSKFLFVETRGMPILTQAIIVSSNSANQANLVLLTQTLQILEIIDILTVEEEPNEQVYHLLDESLQLISQNGSKKALLLENIKQIIGALGFGPPENFSEFDVKEYIEDLTSQRLRTKKFLTAVGQNKVQ